MLTNSEKRLQVVREGQKNLLGKILLTSLAAGTTLYGGAKLLEMLSEKPLKGKKRPVYIPNVGGPTEKKEIGDMDKFSAVKSAGWFGDTMEEIDLAEASPYTVPLALLAAGGGLYGGYKGTEYLYNILRGREQSTAKDELSEEERRLLDIRAHLAKRSVQEKMDTAFDRYLDKKPMEKQAITGQLAGVGLTVGGLLWLLAHNKVKNYMVKKDKDRQRFNMIKNKIETTDLDNAVSGNYIELEAPGSGQVLDAEEEKKKKKLKNRLKQSSDAIFSAVNNLSPDNFQDLNNYASTEAQTAASDPATGDALSAPFLKNKPQIKQQIRQAAKAKMQSLPGFLLAGNNQNVQNS